MKEEYGEDGDDDEIVEYRGPHHRSEGAARVCDLAKECKKSIEEDLWQAEEHENERDLCFPTSECRCVEAHQEWREQNRNYRDQ